MKTTNSSNNVTKNGCKQISPYSLLGIVVHETLENILKPFIGKLIQADFRISNRVLYSNAEEILEQNIGLVDWSSIDEREQLLDWVRKEMKVNLRNAKTLLNTNARNHKILEVEEKWFYEIKPGFKLTLLPDLILESPESELVVVDWKTQKDLKSDVNDSQLGVYKLLAEKKYSADDIQTVIAYTSRIQWCKPWYSHSFTSELESNIVEEIELWKSRDIDNFPANPHPRNCSSCPQLTRCEKSLVSAESFFD